MRKLLIFYCFVFTTILAISGFLGAESIPQLFSAALFYPLAVYFLLLIVPGKKAKAIVFPQKATEKNKQHKPQETLEEEVVELEKLPDSDPKFDLNRRAFLKLIGSAGISLFLFTLFTKKAQAAFFGSVPGPGTVALKDSAGLLIDPSEKQPTDGYNITDLDDSSPAYYGFVNKSGAWFIMKEDSAGAYRYIKGASSYSTSWTGRAGLSYDYFDNVF